MKKIFLFSFSLLLLFLLKNNCSAQHKPDSSVLYRIETIDGNEFIGNIMSQDSAKVYFKTQNLVEMSIPRNEIKQLNQIDIHKMKYGGYWFENPQSTRYFWAPNGYGLKEGEGYYQNVWVFYNQVSVGVTDYFSIGAGMVPLFLFAGSSTPFWIVPKFSIPVIRDKLNLGVGAIAGTVLGEPKSGFGIVYGVSTFGSRDNNISVGLGYGYAGGDWANTPLVNLSGMVRIGRNNYLITDNYFIGFGDHLTTLLSFGGRSIVRRSAGIDYGLVIPVTSDLVSFIAIPWLGISIPFGNTARRRSISGNNL
jgi:hypothetical protein